MLREALQHRDVPAPLFQHLRGRFDEVPFGADARDARPARLACEEVMQEMAELVEKGDDLGVFEERRVLAIGLREIADQGAFGKLAAADAGRERELGRVAVLVLARVQVEEELPEQLAVLEDLPGRHLRMPDGRVPSPHLDVEQLLGSP
jgi:hypothetical protein